MKEGHPEITMRLLKYPFQECFNAKTNPHIVTA